MPLEKLGPYKIEQLLGRGGMGAVYAGTHEETGETVAIKVLSLVLAGDISLQERFAGEIETLLKLKHENIVQLSGYGEHDGYLFYVMDLVDGRSLQDHLDSGRRFQWREVISITEQICAALKHAHDRGIVHRDLKPANLLLTSDDSTIKLTDFGIAKLFGGSQITAIGGVIGTADYMAPEQADGGVATARTDLYSLGSVMYALFAGKPPFAAPTIAQSLERLKNEEARKLSVAVPGVPEEMSHLVMQLLSKDPANRIATARAVANRLKAFSHAMDRQPNQSGFDGKPADAATIIQHAPTLSEATDSPDSPEDTSSRATVAQSGHQAHFQQPNEGDFDTSFEEAKDNRFVSVPESHLDQEADIEYEQGFWLKTLVITVAVVSISGLLYYNLQPTSEATLFAKLKDAAENSDDLSSLKSQIDDYLDRFPNSEQAIRVEQWQEEAELERFERRLTRIAKRNPEDSTLTPLQIVYLETLRRGNSDIYLARLHFQQIVTVYGSMPNLSRDDERVIDLARRQVRSLDRQISWHSQKTGPLLSERMDTAEKLMATDPEKARRICRGIVDLYGNALWAKTWVARAKELLAK